MQMTFSCGRTDLRTVPPCPHRSLSIWSYAVCVYFTARFSSIWIEIFLHGQAASDWTAQSWFTTSWRWTQRRSWQKTDHGPKVVSHLLPVLKDGPEEEIAPRMFAALLQLREVLLAVEQSALCWLLLKHTDSTLGLLNMHRERGSCKQFMQHSISTWVVEFMEYVTAKSITPTAKEVVF